MNALLSLWERKLRAKYYCPLCGQEMRKVRKNLYRCPRCLLVWELHELSHDGIPLQIVIRPWVKL